MLPNTSEMNIPAFLRIPTRILATAMNVATGIMGKILDRIPVIDSSAEAAVKQTVQKLEVNAKSRKSRDILPDVQKENIPETGIRKPSDVELLRSPPIPKPDFKNATIDDLGSFKPSTDIESKIPTKNNPPAR